MLGGSAGDNLAHAAESPARDVPRQSSRGLGFFRGAIPWWIAVGSSQRGDSVGGTVIVRGSLGEECVASLRIALQQALAEILTSAAGPDLEVAVSAGKWMVGPELRKSELSQGSMAFTFEALLGDPHDRSPVVELLRLEAESGGARRLLPLLANVVFSAVGHLSLRIELASKSCHV